MPTIKNFSNYDVNNEIYITKIESDNFSIPVHISVAKEEVAKLQNRSFKPKVIFKYENGKLRISKATVSLNNKEYPTKIASLSNYNKNFFLSTNVMSTSIIWGSRELNAKAGVIYIKEKAKTKRVKKKKQKIKTSNKMTPEKAAIEICMLYKSIKLREILKHRISALVVSKEKMARLRKDMPRYSSWFDCSNLTLKHRFNFWWVYSNNKKTGLNFRINEKKNDWEY